MAAPLATRSPRANFEAPFKRHRFHLAYMSEESGLPAEERAATETEMQTDDEERRPPPGLVSLFDPITLALIGAIIYLVTSENPFGT
eukprot:CAMPEP_0174707242 /NCGR_PEP_ID=MMETSP1094-20130205/9814_1 /TAXON_ID=156173 /ORGANISM="Chrysochromulina brevifilum, Strain UTEX LB 985" /LENGTH=86 /DNA_ID=CAMNT_0015905597 /DNA_START=24 /DNA_END=284 /DNA_ORIENTATION=+